MQVDGKSFSDPILTELIWSSQAFGAKRWIVTLERMYERFAFSMETRTMAISEPEGTQLSMCIVFSVNSIVCLELEVVICTYFFLFYVS